MNIQVHVRISLVLAQVHGLIHLIHYLHVPRYPLLAQITLTTQVGDVG